MWTIILAAASLAVSIISLVVSLRIDGKRHRTLMFTEYTKRFQEIILHLYSDPQNKSAYHRLYFDLCSEEYYLKSTKQLPNDIWDKWVYGMKLVMKHESLRASWKVESVNYDNQKEFRRFFDNIINRPNLNQY